MDTLQSAEPTTSWTPTKDIIKNANITHFMQAFNISDLNTFKHWATEHRDDFWKHIINTLGIVFKKPPEKICDLSQGIESPRWLPGAKLNIVDSCFTASPNATALIYEDANKNICHLTYAELNQLSNRVANSLIKLSFKPGNAIGIIMPMNVDAVAIYLGIIKMGAVVVSIADSFSSQEIAVRLNIAQTKAVFTQDYIKRNDKKLPLYEKVQQALAPLSIVLPCEKKSTSSLRSQDYAWKDFLLDNNEFISVACDPMSACNILFSSGTTGEPKAIAWNHTTAIKVASDAYFHQNIKPHDVLAWPSSLGWMMGPWLLFAAFINHATAALYTDVPKDHAFGEFVQSANVTMLGVIPTLVATWRQTKCMEQLDWHKIKVFTSTGECSNPVDMAYLMALAGNKPIIEYCGGTEIGGAYLSSTVVEPNYPAQFSTPTIGLDILILDEQGHLASVGEVAIIPPSIGLSTSLLNADHHQVYFANMPLSNNGTPLRRHGDQIKQLPNGYYTILGRVDDTMNIGGIKVSAAEIERALVGLTQIREVAAIAVSPPSNGPSLLVIYAATQETLVKETVMKEMQQRISERINPLFRIHDVVFVSELPKTASNKIMRRVLRNEYEKS